MTTNRGVVYKGHGKVEVEAIPFPQLVDPKGKGWISTAGRHAAIGNA